MHYRFKSVEEAERVLHQYRQVKKCFRPHKALLAQSFVEGHAAGKLEGIAEALTPRPVEDAPKDGSIFIGFEINSMKNIISIGEAQFYEESKDFEFTMRANDGDNLTHWLPMPTLPKEANDANT